MQKTCRDCESEKSLEDFYRDAKKIDGFSLRCKDCHKLKYAQTTEYRRLHRYGLDAESYQELLVSQGGRCATCGTAPEKFYVDHDHACCPGTRTCGNCVRGLLCFNCNTALGQVKDSPQILLAMIQYLNGDVT
jgi:hypothetical protein